jgi:predicted NBD/HSP70 family sugar kinase
VHSLLRAEGLAEIYSQIGEPERPVQDIAAAAREGDTAALEACRAYGCILGKTLSWVSNIIDPEVMVIGGSGAQDFDLFKPGIDQFLHRPDIQIAQSELGESAAILGAAYGALEGGTTK